MENTYVFAIYIGLEHDDIVEIKVQANNVSEATGKVKMILCEQVDIQVTGLYLDDWFEN